MIEFKNSDNINISAIPETPLVHQMEKGNQIMAKKTILTIVLILFSGILTGYLLSSAAKKQQQISSGTIEEKSGQKKIVGSADTKTFKDFAEGVLEEGGVNGEGTHRLIRPGGDSQTVYLTSSVLDLNQFIGKKVRVWGETFSAQKAGWLMDVGKIEVL